MVDYKTNIHIYTFTQTQFDIDRYLVRDEKKKAGIYSLQWGGGRHMCLGTRFATMEILFVVREIFSKYTLTKITEGVETSKSQLGTSDKPTRPVYIAVAKKGNFQMK